MNKSINLFNSIGACLKEQVELKIMYFSFRNSRKTLAFESLLAIVWSGALIYALYSTSISEKLIYPYLILVLIVCIAFSTINTIINIIINKKYLHKD